MHYNDEGMAFIPKKRIGNWLWLCFVGAKKSIHKNKGIFMQDLYLFNRNQENLMEK